MEFHGLKTSYRMAGQVEKTLQVINQMEADGIITRYAIGGAIAAIFYIEPFATYDIDIFIAIPEAQDALLSLTPIYEYLSALGYEAEHEAIVIEEWPVQFLPVFNPLLEEALEQARDIIFEQTPTRVFKAEHLVAIMLEIGRAKDHVRIIKFLEERAVDLQALSITLSKHNLTEKWQGFLIRFELKEYQ